MKALLVSRDILQDFLEPGFRGPVSLQRPLAENLAGLPESLHNGRNALFSQHTDKLPWNARKEKRYAPVPLYLEPGSGAVVVGDRGSAHREQGLFGITQGHGPAPSAEPVRDPGQLLFVRAQSDPHEQCRCHAGLIVFRGTQTARQPTVTGALSMAVFSASAICSGSSPTESIPLTVMPMPLSSLEMASPVGIADHRVNYFVSYCDYPGFQRRFHPYSFHEEQEK